MSQKKYLLAQLFYQEWSDQNDSCQNGSGRLETVLITDENWKTTVSSALKRTPELTVSSAEL